MWFQIEPLRTNEVPKRNSLRCTKLIQVRIYEPLFVLGRLFPFVEDDAFARRRANA
jgi:hypothetical protein